MGGNEMKANKKVIESRIEEFCRNSSEVLQNIHLRCGDVERGGTNGQSKKGRKKRAKRK